MTDQVLEIKRAGGVARVKLLSGDTLKIPSALYLQRRLRPGQAVDPEDYRRFIRENGYAPALEMAVKYLALRDRSEKEIVSRLRRSCYDETTIARVMEKLAGHDLISDARFAENWALHRGKRYGKNRIARELRQKGIDDATARAALDALPEEDEMRSALALARKLTRRPQIEQRKIIDALLRRGYSFSVARQAADRALNEQD